MIDPPYPPDTRAKGWRLELHVELIEQLAEFVLAPAEVRAWQIYLFFVAWKQTPAGSLDGSDSLIAARMGMPAKTFAKYRDALMRGWVKCSDGRWYHHLMIECVLNMLAKRGKDALRSAQRRSRAAGDAWSPAGVTRDAAVTHEGVGGESDTKHHAQGTRTRKGRAEVLPPDRARAQAFAEQVCKAMRAAGLKTAKAGDPAVLALCESGATEAEFVCIAEEAVLKEKGFAWAMSALRGRRADASKDRGAGGSDAAEWHETLAGVAARGASMGMPWSDDGWVNGEWMAFPTYKARVIQAASLQQVAA